MRIGLIDVDGHHFPNLALMKISAYHKAQGDDVEWHWGWGQYDRVYMSKVFNATYSPDVPEPLNAAEVIKCLFYLPTRRRCDLTNLLEAVDDLLVHCGIIADDHYGIVEAHDGSRCFVDKDNPRTEIAITRIIDPAQEAQMRMEDLK